MSAVKNKKLIGDTGYWLIFSGFPVAIVSACFVYASSHQILKRIVNPTALGCLLFFTPLVMMVLSRLLYERLQKRVAIFLGIVGWTVALPLLCWFFWFGPGALKLKYGN